MSPGAAALAAGADAGPVFDFAAFQAYFVSPAWLKIGPNFDPLRKNPRFQRLVAGAK